MQVASIFGAFAAAQLLMSPVAGGLASRYGRRRVLTAGVLLVSSSTVLFGVAAAALEGQCVPPPRAMLPPHSARTLSLARSRSHSDSDTHIWAPAVRIKLTAPLPLLPQVSDGARGGDGAAAGGAGQWGGHGNHLHIRDPCASAHAQNQCICTCTCTKP